MQVQTELTWLYAHAGVRIGSAIGGLDGRREGEVLARGTHIVVGTPGRLCDHLRRGRLDLSALRVVVLDEADEMLDLGFREELDTLLEAAPSERRTLLFSATIAKEIAALAREYQRDALRINTLVRNQPHADISYIAVRTPVGETEHAVVNVLRYSDSPTALVFCATREGVRHLQTSLQERGFTCVALSGDLTQNERTRALQSLRDGLTRVCVATDVAARGLDLPDLGLVIHADLPGSSETLLHRSGRTGRAGKKGQCVLIVAANRARRAEQLLQSAGVRAEWTPPPSAELIRARDGDRLLADPILAEPAAPEDAELIERLVAGRDAAAIAGALIQLYRSRLPAPEEISNYIPPAGGATRAPRDTRDRAPRRDARPASGEPMTWFSMNVGRSKNADPKWLIPMLCRMGGLTKADIGSIRIFANETKFEIVSTAADRFRSAAEGSRGDGVTIRQTGAPLADRPRAPRGREEPSFLKKRSKKLSNA